MKHFYYDIPYRSNGDEDLWMTDKYQHHLTYNVKSPGYFLLGVEHPIHSLEGIVIACQADS
jgi:hypothetical protein